MTYKLLVLDVDGTLLNEKNVISEKDKKALDEVRRRGVFVSLCTGRVNQATQTVLKRLSLDGYHIFSDGAVIASSDNSEQIYLKPVEDKTLCNLVDYVHRNKINSIDFFSARHFYIEPQTEKWMVKIRREFFELEPEVVNFSELCGREKVIKATMAIDPVKEKDKVEKFSEHFENKLRLSHTKNATYPDLDWINIIDPAVSKAEALRFLASYLKVPLEEVIAIGDGKNDIPLLLCAGMPIAMGHAPQEVKDCASYVTLDVGHSGVAAAIKKFLL